MDATKRFTGLAEGYARYRPKYSWEFIDYLVETNSLTTSSVIADIGSGTGILSAQLLEKGFAVLAVEPNRDMRETAERLLVSYPGFRSINGVAEATTLEDGSVDLITVAQAFHWFDREKFKLECRRILRKGAKVALVWNSRMHDSDVVRENEQVCLRHCPNFVAFGSGIEREPGVFERFFTGGVFECRAFRNDERFDLEGLIGRSLSGSYAPKVTDKNYDPYIRELSCLFDKYSVNGLLTLPAETHSYLGYM